MKIKDFKLKFEYSILIALISISGKSNAQSKIVNSSNPNLYYEGRIKYDKDAAELIWPGSSVTVNFEGTSISAILKDADTASYYNIILDDSIITKIHPDTLQHIYLLASALSDKKHKIELFKLTDWDLGKTKFYGFEVPENTKVLSANPSRKRKIEFYGNSITSGYAMEDYTGHDSWHGYFEDNYLSYAAITARHFNAQYHCISKSGIGIMVSWFPLIMPEMYDRLDPTDSTLIWDFNRYTPDVVVVNLFQNDSWIVKLPENAEFKHRFGTIAPDSEKIIASYKNFILLLRSKYPKANIICSLGSMDATRHGSPWPGYIQSAIEQLNDKKIYAHFFDYKNTDGHPKVAEQEVMAKSLIEFIDKNIKW